MDGVCYLGSNLTNYKLNTMLNKTQTEVQTWSKFPKTSYF